MKPLCIYHGNCADGFGAAWAVRNALGDGVEFHSGVYQDAPPNVYGRDVVMVDFSYKRAVIDEIVSKASSLLILDHHKSAADDLQGLPAARASWAEHFYYAGAPGCSHIGAIFDMERSGAGLAWDYFHPGVTRPALIDHIEDRDLWRFKLSGTREIQAALFSYPYDFDVWDRLMRRDVLALEADGHAIERKHHKDICELVKVVTRPMRIGGYDSIPMANLPHTLTSDAGHLLCKMTGMPFAGCYWDTPEGRVFSLRSLDDGADVAEIAKQYGGGGHAHASGFRVPFHKLAQFEVAGAAAIRMTV